MQIRWENLSRKNKNFPQKIYKSGNFSFYFKSKASGLQKINIYFEMENHTMFNKKTLTAVFLAIAIISALSACGGAEPTPTLPPATEAPATETPVVTEAPASVDLEAFFTSATEGYEMAALADADADMLEAFYPGLKDIPTVQLVAKLPMMTSVVCEFVLVEVENSEDVETVKGILETRVQTQADGGAFYPESVEGWKKAQVAVNGNYVIMIAYEKAAEIVDSFNAQF